MKIEKGTTVADQEAGIVSVQHTAWSTHQHYGCCPISSHHWNKGLMDGCQIWNKCPILQDKKDQVYPIRFSDAHPG
jgi:hypothetical protein